MTTFTCDHGMFTTATGTIATVLAHHHMFPTATVEPILTRLWHIMTFIPLLRLRSISKPFYHIMTCLLLARRGQYRHGSGTSWHVCYCNYGTDNIPALAHYVPGPIYSPCQVPPHKRGWIDFWLSNLARTGGVVELVLGSVFIIELDAGLAGIYFHRHCTEYNVCHKQLTQWP